jgi:hypothetical protein
VLDGALDSPSITLLIAGRITRNETGVMELHRVEFPILKPGTRVRYAFRCTRNSAHGDLLFWIERTLVHDLKNMCFDFCHLSFVFLILVGMSSQPVNNGKCSIFENSYLNDGEELVHDT